MAPIVLSSEEPPSPRTNPADAAWHVWVAADADDLFWRAKCDTFDEAIELADGYRKRYHVTIESRPRCSITH
jgi:hypothetical protein